MKKNVLIFPCGSEIGLELHRSLQWSTHFNIVGASSMDDHGKYVYEQYVGNLPFIGQDGFLEAMNKVIREFSIDYVFPAHDNAVLYFAEQYDAGTLACEVITSPLKTCQIARSKALTYKVFKDVVPVARVYKDAAEVTQSDLPVFLKPDTGYGSRGVCLAKTIDDIAYNMGRDESLLILEYLPGKEYTIDCFTDSNGVLQYCKGRQRTRVSNGISVNSVRIDNPQFKVLAERINKHVTFNGVWFFQVKEAADGTLTLLEIAPRIAGTMGLSRAKGVNLALISLFNAMGKSPEISENNYEVVIDRALQSRYEHNIQYDQVFMDFDDLVIFEGKVNPLVMMYVFQCHNKGIKVHLITRHAHDIHEALRNYRLTGIFDDIITIGETDEKCLHISHNRAIFIDDSYAERKKVAEACGIPVFDAHNLEVLLDKYN